MKTIEVKRIKHRGEQRIGLFFAYDPEIITTVKTLPGRRYSQSKKCWHLPNNKDTIHRLKQFFPNAKFSNTTSSKNRTVNKAIIPGITLEKITDMQNWMQQKRYSTSTIETYISFVKQFFSYYPQLQWDAITANKIEEYNYKHFIVGKKSYSAQNQWINAIKLYLKVHSIMGINELDAIQRPRKVHYLPDVLSQDEIRCILEKTVNMKHKTLLMLTYSSGLRIGEVLRLRIHDIKSDEGLIYIRQSKGAKDRRVPLSPVLLEQLRKYYKSYKPKSYLFEGQKVGNPYSSQSALKVLKRAVKLCRITKRVTLHTLRHSFATHLTQNGVNLQYIQEILGHNSPKTTMIYTHLSGKDIKGIRSPLDDLDIEI